MIKRNIKKQNKHIFIKQSISEENIQITFWRLFFPLLPILFTEEIRSQWSMQVSHINALSWQQIQRMFRVVSQTPSLFCLWKLICSVFKPTLWRGKLQSRHLVVEILNIDYVTKVESGASKVILDLEANQLSKCESNVLLDCYFLLMCSLKIRWQEGSLQTWSKIWTAKMFWGCFLLCKLTHGKYKQHQLPATLVRALCNLLLVFNMNMWPFWFWSPSVCCGDLRPIPNWCYKSILFFWSRIPETH